MSQGTLVHRSVLAMLAALICVAGCQTTDPYTGEGKTSKTAKGAGIGAVAGAVVGILTGGDARAHRKNALIGAGVGALAGAGVGQYMDRQESKLRAQLQGTGVSVTRIGDNLTLNMPGNVTFQTDSSVTLVLKEYDKTIIEVAGHTDNTGDTSYNQQLSERRASSVAQYLETKGINQQRVMTVGAGETRPVASNDTPQGRQSNRRVELTLEPITQG